MIEPLKNRVIIQMPEPKEYTESGLTIPEAAQTKEDRGTIVAVGTGVKENLSVGDIALIGKHDGVAVKPEYCDGLTNCVIVSEDHIRAIFPDEKQTNVLGHSS